jgi:hypothetical protein
MLACHSKKLIDVTSFTLLNATVLNHNLFAQFCDPIKNIISKNKISLLVSTPPPPQKKKKTLIGTWWPS